MPLKFLTALAAVSLMSRNGENDADRDPEQGTTTLAGTTPQDSSEEDVNGAVGYRIDGNEDEQDEDDEDEDDDSIPPGQPLTRFSTGTSTSTSTHFVRPSLPRWLVKIKDVLFGAPSDEDDEYIPNYRTTPIISGALIPFSILLEIPGLTEHWYVRNENGQAVEVRENSATLDAALALSMVCAVLANIALICRFMEKRVKGSTIICIVFLTVHDLINTVTVLVFGIEHRFDDGFTYGEAYWMTVCSTIVSMVTNFTLIYDLIKTPNFTKSGSGITRKQRSLVIITIIFLSYIALCALIFSIIMGLSFLNGMFFTIVTMLTIGFGDIVPTTTGQRVAVCFLAALGIVILGAAIRLISQAIIEGLEVGYRTRLREFRRRRRERQKATREAKRWRCAVEKRLVETGHEAWVGQDRPPAIPTPPAQEAQAPTPSIPKRPIMRRHGSHFRRASPVHLNIEALAPVQLEEAAQEAGVPLDQYISRVFLKHAQHRDLATPKLEDPAAEGAPEAGSQNITVPRNDASCNEGRVDVSDARNSNNQNKRWPAAWWLRKFHLSRKTKPEVIPEAVQFGKDGEEIHWAYRETVQAMQDDEKRSLYIKLAMAWLFFFVFWTIGSLIFSETENWSYGSAMYFCFIAFTTIGYGDLAPVTPIGRSIFIFWALLGVGAMTLLIAVISDAFSSKYRRVTHNKTFDRAVQHYRQGGRRPSKDVRRREETRSASSKITPALQANIAKFSVPSDAEPQTRPATTLAEAEECLRRRFRPLPTLILEEVQKFRTHMRYFLIANGHTDSATGFAGMDGLDPRKADEVPETLKQLLDEIATQEGIGERLKEEVWQDEYARNTLFVLSLEKGVRTMIDAAEQALDVVAERDRLLAESAGQSGDTTHEALYTEHASMTRSIESALWEAEGSETGI